MEFILNEYSLNGQYASLEEFVAELSNLVGCINIIRKNQNIIISKISSLYSSNITAEECICDLKKLISADDELKRFQIALDNEIYNNPPYWDDDFQQNLEAKYYWGEKDVSMTGMAEAAARDKHLLSFKMNGLTDSEIQISEMNDEKVSRIHGVDSIYTVGYLVKKYGEIIGLTRDEILKVKYKGTRVDYSTIESAYGAEQLQESEYKNLVGTLDKVEQHQSFDTMATDDGLQYKKYSPSQRGKNWFSKAKYRDKQIMKIRCSDVMRVYGYRKDQVFRVLRIERDHKISDNG